MKKCDEATCLPKCDNCSSFHFEETDHIDYGLCSEHEEAKHYNQSCTDFECKKRQKRGV